MQFYFQVPKGTVTEISAADKVAKLRRYSVENF